MNNDSTACPEVVSRDEWLAARRGAARAGAGGHASSGRSQRPAQTAADGEGGEGLCVRRAGREVGWPTCSRARPQLYVHHFMWIDATDRGCPSCTAAAELTFTPGDRALLDARGVTLACVSRAPYPSIARYRDRHGWTFPWYSSRDKDFTYDFHVTLDPTRARWNTTTGPSTSFARTAGPMTNCEATCREPASSCAAATRCSTPTPRTRRARPHVGRVSVPGSDSLRAPGSLGGLPAGVAQRRTAAGVPLHSDHRERNPGGGCRPRWQVMDNAGVAEWLGTGLQSRLHGFESRHSLQWIPVQVKGANASASAR